MIALLSAVLAGAGTLLLLGAHHSFPVRSPFGSTHPRSTQARRATRQLLLGTAAATIGGASICFMIFGAPGAAIVGGGFAASLPIAAHRQRRRDALEVARDAWPRMIEELRVLTSSAGRSLPQAMIEIGSSAPPEMRTAFDEARREWLLSSDLERMLHVLRRELADPTCDAVCETVLIASEVGWADLDRRLTVLAEDRRIDSRHRREARSRQAGVRFARRFVLLVPAGMAIAGLTVGSGGSAYRTPTGQIAVLVALLSTIGCWCWAGAMLRMPSEERVFTS